MTYDPNAFPTSAIDPNQLNIPGASLNNLDYEVISIIGAEDPAQSVYSYQNNQVGFSKTLIIDRVFNIVVKMINILQKAAAAQANRINFLTDWQKAYTDTLNQVHTFAPYNGDSFSNLDAVETFDDNDEVYSDDDKDQITTMQQNLNTVNSTYTTVETNRRSIVSDEAKSMQTSVNQTSDAVNAQSSLATSLLQELSSLLSSVYRSS